MVFIIHSAQDRDARAMQLKADEVEPQEMSDQEFCELASRRGPPGVERQQRDQTASSELLLGGSESKE